MFLSAKAYNLWISVKEKRRAAVFYLDKGTGPLGQYFWTINNKILFTIIKI